MNRLTHHHFIIDTTLAKKLIALQFPQWKDLPITFVEPGGWDNRTFRLGEHMLIRLPSAVHYADKVKKEQYWLPKLAPHLTLLIPTPIALGKPSPEYPFDWSIYHWIDGETVSIQNILDMNQCARDLASFLIALQRLDTTQGPIAGAHNFYRGAPLEIYNKETKQAFISLKNCIDINTAKKIWDLACASSWQKNPVWLHGDIAPTNLLVKNGRLIAVIDFGGLAVGDPACDYAIAWTFFTDQSRNIFRDTLKVDADTWNRARGWALWKALITYAQLPGTNNAEKEKSKQVIDEIIGDYKKERTKEH